MTHRIALAPVIVALTASAALAEAEWIDLFDGKTLDGWVQRGGKATYTVEDGMIVGTTAPDTPNSFLCTEKDYGDFILELEFRCDPKLNSGVQIRSESKPDVKNGRVHGYQCEIDVDDARGRMWAGGIYDESRRGWLYPGKLGGDPKQFTEQGVKITKPNDWNTFRIECRGKSIKTYLNGEPRADLTDDMTLEGFIALQVHSVGKRTDPLHVRWRNIRIQVLEGEKSSDAAPPSKPREDS